MNDNNQPPKNITLPALTLCSKQLCDYNTASRVISQEDTLKGNVNNGFHGSCIFFTINCHPETLTVEVVFL